MLLVTYKAYNMVLRLTTNCPKIEFIIEMVVIQFWVAKQNVMLLYIRIGL